MNELKRFILVKCCSKDIEDKLNEKDALGYEVVHIEGEHYQGNTDYEVLLRRRNTEDNI